MEEQARANPRKIVWGVVAYVLVVAGITALIVYRTLSRHLNLAGLAFMGAGILLGICLVFMATRGGVAHEAAMTASYVDRSTRTTQGTGVK